MTNYWQRISLKIDALTLRERVIIFAMVALALVTGVTTFLLDPQFAKQKALLQRIKQEQSQISAIEFEIQQKVRPQANDPDAQARAQIQTLRQQLDQLQGELRSVQNALVSADKMADVLESMLKNNGKLQLLSLKTLTPEDLNEAPSERNKPAIEPRQADSPKPKDGGQASIYRHGVEIAVQGSYLDILGYLGELESLPWQLFWGKAVLNVEEHPKAVLTLTLFTLSLEKKWLNI